MAKSTKATKETKKEFKSILTKADLSFMEKYLNTYSPVGFEAPGQKVWLDFIKPFVDTHEVDNYGTVYGVINPKAPFKVVIEAHADEIAWFVNFITEDGLIYVKRNGGSDHMIAPSNRVHIHTKKGLIPGFFGWPAIHTRAAGKEETPDMKNIFIETGCTSKKEVLEKGIEIGSVITFQSEFMNLNDRYYVGRALDNRMGGFMIAMVAKLLHQNKKKLPFALYIVNSVQEEIGLRGAEMIANTIKPTVAIVTDVCHDTSTPMINKIVEGDVKCGAGPVLTVGPAVHNKLLDMIKEVAVKNNISYQMDTAYRATGTDTDAFAYANGGTPSALISLPLRYMHTTVETVHKEDVENVIHMIYHTLNKLTPTFNFKYL
jgi:putative aminopeptidase FrvX